MALRIAALISLFLVSYFCTQGAEAINAEPSECSRLIEVLRKYIPSRSFPDPIRFSLRGLEDWGDSSLVYIPTSQRKVMSSVGLNHYFVLRAEPEWIPEVRYPDWMDQELRSLVRQEMLGGPRVLGIGYDEEARPLLIVQKKFLPIVGDETLDPEITLNALDSLYRRAWAHNWVLYDARLDNFFIAYKQGQIQFVPFDVHPIRIEEPRRHPNDSEPAMNALRNYENVALQVPTSGAIWQPYHFEMARRVLPKLLSTSDEDGVEWLRLRGFPIEP